MSSRFRQIKGHLRPRNRGSCLTLPSIFPAPPRGLDQNQSCCSDSVHLPALLPQIEHGRRQGQRTWKKKDRGDNYWRRVHESASLNEEEKLLTKLKGIDGLPWKEIVVKFNEKMDLDMRQPALQMRLTRLADRMDILWAQESPFNTQLDTPSDAFQSQPQPQLQFQPQPQSQSQFHSQSHSQSVSQLQPPSQTFLQHHLSVDSNFARENFLQPGFSTTTPMLSPVSWSEINESSSYLPSNLSTISQDSETFCFNYHHEPQPGPRLPSYGQQSNCNIFSPGSVPNLGPSQSLGHRPNLGHLN